MRDEVRDYVARRHPGARVETLPGDASTRTFHRLHLPDGTTRILMDYGGCLEAPPRDVLVAGILAEAGLRSAAIREVDLAGGLLEWEDLGDTPLEALFAPAGAFPTEDAPRQARLRSVLRRAVEQIAALQHRGTPVYLERAGTGGPALDAGRFRAEMDFFLEHYVGALLGRRVRSGLRDTLYALADEAATTRAEVLCHRDYHSRNLMLLPGDALAMVDIQDACLGPETYDLASFLWDAYVEWPPAWRDEAVAWFLALRPVPDPHWRLRASAAQRMVKALGTFGYQVAARGLSHYLPAARRTWRRLVQELPGWQGLGEVAGWLRELPPPAVPPGRK